MSYYHEWGVQHEVVRHGVHGYQQLNFVRLSVMLSPKTLDEIQPLVCEGVGAKQLAVGFAMTPHRLPVLVLFFV